MKTIVEVNSNNYASTGNIMLNIAKEARNEGYKVYTCCRNSREGHKYHYEDQIYIGTWFDHVVSDKLSYIFGLNGCFNFFNTLLFINKLKKIKPDLVHIHSMCDNYLYVNMFFSFLRKNDIPVIWTLHDNWAFTGRCAQFRCEKWIEGCGNCPHLDYFPASLFLDNTAKIWKKREKLYNSIKNMMIVTPSKWLAGLAEISLFKKNHPIKVINNGINLDLFRPIESDFRKEHDLEDKYLILGLAYFWDEGKGLHVFKELARRLPDKYKIIMVGTNDEIDKELPENILSIHKTYNQEELVKIYSAVDLFVNPSIEENFPTVNMEALGCGLPLLVYDKGGNAETLDKKSGSKVEPGDIDKLEKEIIRICETRPYSKEDCLRRSKDFDMVKKYKEYVKLYKEIIG